MNRQVDGTAPNKLSAAGQLKIPALLGLFTATALVLYSIRSFGPAIAVLSVLLLGVAEATLLYWVYGRTGSADRRLFTREEAKEQSRIARKEGLSLSALRGRAYSQEHLFSELKSVLVERTCAARMISHRQMRELASADGMKLFGSELLLRLYNDSLMETSGKRPKPLPAGRFLELFNRLVEEILEVK